MTTILSLTSCSKSHSLGRLGESGNQSKWKNVFFLQATCFFWNHPHCNHRCRLRQVLPQIHHNSSYLDDRAIKTITSIISWQPGCLNHRPFSCLWSRVVTQSCRCWLTSGNTNKMKQINRFLCFLAIWSSKFPQPTCYWGRQTTRLTTSMPTLERNLWVPCVFGNIYISDNIRYADTLTWRSFTVFHDESLDKEQVAGGVKNQKWHKNLSRQRRCTECLPKRPPLPSLTLATSATWTQGCRLWSSIKKTVDWCWCWCQ